MLVRLAKNVGLVVEEKLVVDENTKTFKNKIAILFRARGLGVMTSASRAEGREFESPRAHTLLYFDVL